MLCRLVDGSFSCIYTDTICCGSFWSDIECSSVNQSCAMRFHAICSSRSFCTYIEFTAVNIQLTIVIFRESIRHGFRRDVITSGICTGCRSRCCFHIECTGINGHSRGTIVITRIVSGRNHTYSRNTHNCTNSACCASRRHIICSTIDGNITIIG